MSNMISFINRNSLSFSSVEFKKPYVPIAGWKEMNPLLDSDKFFKSHMHGIMINLNGLYSRFVILDTDDVKSYNFVKKLIIDNKLNEVKTPSRSQIENKSLYYKSHFWFKVQKGVKITQKQYKDHKDYGSLDILTQIVEHITSTINEDELSYIPEELLAIFEAIRDEEVKEKVEFIEEENKEEPEEKIKEILNLINDKRASSYEDWRNIGMILKSIDETFFNLFDEFSSRGNEYKGTSDVRRHWKSYKTSGNNLLKLGSLIHYAKQDNLSGFNKWCLKWNNKDNIIKSEYEEMKEKLEKRLFFLETPVSYGWADSENNITFKSMSDIKQILKPYKINKKQFFDLWLEDNSKRQYIKTDFIPKIDYTGNIYNLFTGFKYENNKPINQEKIKPFFKFMNNLFNNEEVSINSVLDWIAWIRQKPHIKSEKCIVLYSETQGAGKNTFIQIVSKIIGYSTPINDIKDLVKNFNAHMTCKLLIYGDEIKVKAKELRDDLKNMITRTDMVCERKGIDSFKMNDYSNYIFTTNNQNSFYVEPTDRRFMLFNVAEKSMSEQDANEIYKLLDDDEFIMSLDSYFRTRELPLKIVAPNNAYKKLLIAQSTPAYIQMIYSQPHKFVNNEWRVSDLYEVSINYAKSHYLESTFSKEKMCRDIKADFEVYFKRGKHYNYYQFPEENEFIEHLKKTRKELLMDY